MKCRFCDVDLKEFCFIVRKGKKFCSHACYIEHDAMEEHYKTKEIKDPAIQKFYTDLVDKYTVGIDLEGNVIVDLDGLNNELREGLKNNLLNMDDFIAQDFNKINKQLHKKMKRDAKIIFTPTGSKH